MNYHEAHRPYMEAVARAMDAAGIQTGNVEAEPNDPRNGWIELSSETAQGAFGAETAAVFWTEEQGWGIGWGDADHALLDYHSALPVGLLATPAEVVKVTRAALATVPGPDRGGYFRSFMDEDDGFEARLAEAGKGTEA